MLKEKSTFELPSQMKGKLYVAMFLSLLGIFVGTRWDLISENDLYSFVMLGIFNAAIFLSFKDASNTWWIRFISCLFFIALAQIHSSEPLSEWTYGLKLFSLGSLYLFSMCSMVVGFFFLKSKNK